MALNCKPGDIARVISPGVQLQCPCCGGRAIVVDPDTLVRCVALDTDGCWSIEEPIGFDITFDCVVMIHLRGLCTGIDDSKLRPIRDPGDDAVDEMVKRAGMPTPLAGVPVEEV